MKTKERRHTKEIHQQITLFISLRIADNTIGDTGATSLSEAMKSNTTLTKLDLSCEDKRKTHKRSPSTNHSFSFLFSSTVNTIGDTGTTSLNEPLKSNTTLAELDLCGEDKRKTHKRNPSTNHSFSFLFTSTGNSVGDTGATSLSESLKSNTTLAILNLRC